MESDKVDAPASDSQTREDQNTEKVWLQKATALRLAAWSEDLKERFWGKSLSKAELVNFLILTHPPSLSEAEIASLQAKYFDPIRVLEWAAKKAKEAKARGESVDIRAIVDPVMKLHGRSAK